MTTNNHSGRNERNDVERSREPSRVCGSVGPIERASAAGPQGTPPPEGTTEPLKRGQEFYAAGLGLFLTVIRVARDATWADVFVAQPATGATWSKRQRLIDGAFPFTAHEVTR